MMAGCYTLKQSEPEPLKHRLSLAYYEGELLITFGPSGTQKNSF